MAAPHSLIDAKIAARRWARSVRAACDPSLGVRLGEHVTAGWSLPRDAVIAGFWPMADEIDIRPLLVALSGRGHPVALPVTPGRGQALTFRLWRPGDTLVAERFGTFCPAGETAAPDFLLVPLLAWDGAGRRLGYGGGYYDRTLAGLRDAATLGCGFAATEMDEVPAGPYDVRLDAVATELGVTRCGSAA